MASGDYQRADAHIVDYDLVQLGEPGLGLFRGPRPDPPYVAFVGAAQTFGRLCDKPFPTLVAEQLSMGCLNLGRGGAGPGFFLAPSLLDLINGAELTVVQVLSARSVSNSRFEILYGADGRLVARDELMNAEEFYAHALRSLSVKDMRGLVNETRLNYIKLMRELLCRITTPKVVFWFSVRPPGYEMRFDERLAGLLGGFPDLVDERTWDELLSPDWQAVQCISRRGLPRTLRDRTGRPTSMTVELGGRDDITYRRWTDSYYPSPEMHEDAADALLSPCRSQLG